MIWKGEQNMKKWMRVLPVLGAAVLLTVGFGHQTAQAKKGEHPVIADRIWGIKLLHLPSMMFLWRQQQRN